MKPTTMATLRTALDANVPVLLWGSPGTAKTAILSQEAIARGLFLHVVNVSHYEPTELNGWLVPDVESGVMRRLPPDWLADACERPCLLLLDEFSTAAPAQQAATLRLLQERHVGGKPLHPETRFALAANPPEQAAGGWDLSAPASNRVLHIDWQPDFETWSRWLMTNGPGDPNTRGLVIGYLHSVGAARHLCAPPDSEAGQSHAWASPRSWTNLCACLSKVPAESKDVAYLTCCGCVGEGEAMQFLSWRDQQDLPDPEDLLAEPESWDIPVRQDRTYATLGGVIGAVSNQLTAKRWLAACRIHARVASAGMTDLAAVSAMPLYQMKLGHRPSGLKPRPELARASLPTEREMAPFVKMLKLAGVL
jgi:hypothetical protein